MPNGTGYDVIDHVVDNNLHVKVVVVSGNTDFDSTRNALRKGAYDFLRKPYVPDELLATVKNATNKKQLELANEAINQKLMESEHLHRFIVDQLIPNRTTHGFAGVIDTLHVHMHGGTAGAGQIVGDGLADLLW